MAAPSNTVWGSVSSNGKGKLGIAVSVTSSTNTQVTINVQVWLALKYNISDSSNSYSFSYTNDSGTTTTNPNGENLSLNFGTTSGSGWADGSQKQLGSYSLTYTKKTSSRIINLSSTLSGLGSDNYSVSVSTTYTVPTLSSYTITYNANGGTGAPGSQSYYYGNNIILSTTIPIKEGYEFLGWSLSNAATSASYQPGQTWSGTNASNYTLYAVWEKTITLMYDANGGYNSPSSQTVTIYNSDINPTFIITSDIPLKNGFKFLGWGLHELDTEVSYSASDEIILSESLTLYAIWEAQNVGYVKDSDNMYKVGFSYTKNNNNLWNSAIVYVKDVDGKYKQSII